MLRLANTKPELAVVADQFGAPTWARMIAEATAQLVARCGGTSTAMLDTLGQHGGIYHLSAAGRTSWHGFAETIIREAGLATPVRAITTKEYPVPASRPANSLLSGAKLAERFGIALPGWEQAVKLCMAELALRSLQNSASANAGR
jgi:dTDP-4-dehydrorhamnose reductase